MRHVDTILADEALVAAVYEALGRRHPKSRARGRRAAPAEMLREDPLPQLAPRSR